MEFEAFHGGHCGHVEMKKVVNGGIIATCEMKAMIYRDQLDNYRKDCIRSSFSRSSETGCLLAPNLRVSITAVDYVL
jgi:hypothetical protein